MTLACSACGASHAEGQRFCGECGLPLSLTCASCGATATSGQKFCGDCGATLVVQAAPVTEATEPVRFEQERRQTSVLFVDLVGFTTASEHRDPEDTRQLLDRYYDAARVIVERYGGMIEKFIGDAVMAVWGAPVAREDDAQRAVRAGLDLVAEVATLAQAADVAGLQARGGVVTGVVATTGNSDVALVVGDTVNTASRVQSAAQPGSVLVDETTRAASSVGIAYEDAGLHELKGKSQAARLWRARRVIAGTGVGATQRIDGLEAEFAGRGRDLAVLKEIFHASAEGSRARLVTVFGEAGIGKSRLGWEFEKYVEGLAQTVVWHRGRCLPYGEGVAYSALAEMVRMRLRIPESAPLDQARALLDAVLDQQFDDTAERAAVEGPVGVLIGTEQRSLGRDQLFAGWRLLFERLSESGPVALVFEDLQWADAGLLEFIEHLLDWSAHHPIFVLGLARPELADRHHGWPHDRRDATLLHLDRLPTAIMEGLLDDLVTNLPNATRDLIVQRAEGIPLYAVETVRALIDRDAVVPRGGEYVLEGEIGELDVPASLTSLIGSRLDALAPSERSLVKALSVLGTTFPRESVAAISGLPAAAVDDLLRSLVRKDVLAIRSDKNSPDRGQYTFVQGLMRQVAYDTLANAERQERHVAVARHLRATFPDDGQDVIAVIAAHLVDAATAAPNAAEAGSIRSEAVDALRRSGHRSRALGAPAAAQQAFRAAAGLADDQEERLAIMFEAALAADQGEQNALTIEILEPILAAHRASGNRPELARCLVLAGKANSRLGRADQGIRWLREGLSLFDEDRDGPDIAAACAELVGASTLAGRGDETNDVLERAFYLSQALDLPEVLTRVASFQGILRQTQGRHQEAAASMRFALSVAERHELWGRAMNASANLGDALNCSDLPGAEEASLRGMELAARLGSTQNLVIAGINAAMVMVTQGRWREAEDLLEERFPVENLIDPYQVYPWFHLAVRRGDLERARELAVVIESEYAESENVQDVGTHLELKATLALAIGDNATAAAVGREAVERLLDSMGARNDTVRYTFGVALEAELRRGQVEQAAEVLELVAGQPVGLVPPLLHGLIARYRARIAAARGEHDSVEAEYVESERIFEELAYPHHLAEVQLDHATWLRDRGDHAAAVPLAAAAAETFTRLGAAPKLAEVDELRRTLAAVLT